MRIWAALQAENPALFEIEQQTLAPPQPWRTDFEAVITGKQYVEVKVAPKAGT